MNQKDLQPAGNFAKSGIYRIVNIQDDKIYIGSAINIKNRWSWHKKDLIANKHKNKYLQNAWNKYGQINFKLEVLEFCDKITLLKREQFYLNTSWCLIPFGYNINPKAESSLGLKRSNETKLKQRLLKLGKPQSEAHKEACRKAKLGRKHSEKTKELLRIKNLGNTHGLGFKHSDEVKLIISKTHKGKAKNEDHKKKISEALKQKRYETFKVEISL